jgi:hypothetical protein
MVVLILLIFVLYIYGVFISGMMLWTERGVRIPQGRPYWMMLFSWYSVFYLTATV